MPKKKPSKNGFFQFALELRDKHPQKYPNIQAAVEHANPIWARMSAEDRQPYNQRAQLARNNVQQTKYATDGRAIDEIQKREEDEKIKKQEMKNEIRNLLQNAKINNAVADEEFLIIDINRLIYVPQEDKHYICEIAIVPFSLRNGVDNNKIYHEIVMPGKLPLGFYGDAQIHSKETHQLLDCLKDEDNTPQVYTTMMQYLEKYKKFGKLPILYTNSKCLDLVQKIIDDILYEIRSKYTIKVYDLQYLFYVLRNAVSDEPVWPSESFSDREIEKDVYAYTSRIACDYHEEIDVVTYCSRSRAIRFAYIICDNCCTDLGIALIPGKHVPLSAKVNQQLSVNSQRNLGISAAPSRESLWSNCDTFSEYSVETQWDIGPKRQLLANKSLKPQTNSGISAAYSRETVWSNSDFTENDPDDQWSTVTSKRDKPRAGKTVMPAGMREPFNKNALKFPPRGYQK